MPAKSKAQYGAMAAAMSGNSNLGIPPSVGRDFVKATPPAKRKAFAKKKPAPKPKSAHDAMNAGFSKAGPQSW